ncbi:class I adenylate-forming enzyme family protein [Terrarubrum flagellatum]|uniref:class I adenylate-forming enzyme family protein n=1 Tax=Terrirubrum flagellatum TaxID=2895980 RepID=UPI0031453110
MECLNEMLARNVRMLGDRPFIIAESETLTYTQFDNRTARIGAVLASKGVRQGDCVGLYLPSGLDMALGFWAAQQIGAVPVPMTSMFREGEVRAIVAQSDMAAMIVDETTAPIVAPVRGELPTLRALLLAGGGEHAGCERLAPLIEKASADYPRARCAPGDVAALFFTSGTTGMPKGIAQSQFNQYSTLRDMMCAHRTQFGREIYMCAVPLFTNFGCTVNLNLCLFAGGTIVLHGRWDTEKVLAAIKEHRATYFAGTPTMFVYLVGALDPKRHDLSSLRLCTTGGSPVPQIIMRKFEDASGARVIQVYGATETLGQNVMEPSVGVRKHGAAGLPVGSSRIAIVNDEGKPVPQGEVGEVVISGDCVSLGYWRDPEATAKSFTPAGWLSGDLGYLDEDGYLFIVDRKKDVIIAGGFNIYPLEVESVLYKHPDVAVCAVVGAADESKGEIPVAVVVRKKDANLDGPAVIAWCRENLSAYKAPRRVYFVDELPVQAGKIRKRDLTRMINEGRLAPAT